MARRRVAAVLIGIAAAIGLAACSDDDPAATNPELSDVAPNGDLSPIGLTVSVETQWSSGSSPQSGTGWWDPGRARGALVDESGEPIWHEREGIVLRPAINPNATTEWTSYDLTAWGSVGIGDPGYWGDAGFVELNGAPSIASLAALHETVAGLAETDRDGAQTVMVPGAAFLDSTDEVVARRALHPCDTDVPVVATITDGVVERFEFQVDTTIVARTIAVELHPIDTATEAATPWPADDTILTTRTPEVPVDRQRPPATCDWPDREPFTLERAGCTEPDIPDRGVDEIVVIAAHAARIPGAPGDAWIVPVEPVPVEDLADLVASHDLEVRSLLTQTPLNDGTVASAMGPDRIPTDQAALNATIDVGPPHEVVGDTIIAGFTVTGTWADIARWADSCEIYSVMRSLQGQTPPRPDHFAD